MEILLNNQISTLYIADPNRESLFGSSVSKKVFEQLLIANEFISSRTFSSRRKRYIDEIVKNGFLKYFDQYIIYPNGNLAANGSLVTNLFDEHKNGRIWFGTKYKGVRYDDTNPFQFVISSGAPKIKFFGIESGYKFRFDTYIDNDVFEDIMIHFLQYSSFPNS